MKTQMRIVRSERRRVYRQAKKTLRTILRGGWRGSDASLRRAIQAWLKCKNRGYLFRLVRQGAFALAVAGTLLAAAGSRASSHIELSDVAAGVGGFVVTGIDDHDRAGFSVAGAGDVNGDGLADLIVGAWAADPGAHGSAGESYVVFGKMDGSAVELSGVASGTGGFVINGINLLDLSGISVSGAGDVNGDGLADLIVGAPFARPNMLYRAGESYVVFGKADGTPVELLDVASGMGGFVINGADVGDYSGRSVSGAGDVNGGWLGRPRCGRLWRRPGRDLWG